MRMLSVAPLTFGVPLHLAMAGMFARAEVVCVGCRVPIQSRLLLKVVETWTVALGVEGQQTQSAQVREGTSQSESAVTSELLH
jgi:hypothetical protein